MAFPLGSLSQGWAFARFLSRGACRAGFHGQWRVLAVIKSRKDGRWPFPKRACVGTYAPHPGAFARVAFSGSLRTGSIGALRLWPDPFRPSVFRQGVQWFIAGWSSPVARQAHNLKVIGSNPIPATKQATDFMRFLESRLSGRLSYFGLCRHRVATENYFYTD